MAEMRKAIAAAMARSKRDDPAFLAVGDHRYPGGARLAGRPQRGACRPTERILLGALFVKAAALAAAKVPEMNGHFVDGLASPTRRRSTSASPWRCAAAG